MRTLAFGWIVVLVVALSGCESQSPSPGKTSSSSPASSSPPAAAPDNKPAPSAPSQENSPPSSADSAGGGVIDLETFTLTAPADWPRKPNASQFVLAEFILPRAEGDQADGRLTISAAGGSMKDNIDRWKGQFGGKPEQESQSELQAGGWTITVVELSGEFNDQRGPFAPATKAPGYRMWAAIIPSGEGMSHFIKATGPQKTIAAHVEKLKEFAGTAKKK